MNVLMVNLNGLFNKQCWIGINRDTILSHSILKNGISVQIPFGKS